MQSTAPNLPRLGELPAWADFDRVAIDIETRDDDLRKLGPGVRRTGYITGVSFCCGRDNGPAFYLPIRHEGGGNYDDAERVLEYLREQARTFRGDIVGANLQYDLDYLAQARIKFAPRFFRDIQVSGPLLDQPALTRVKDATSGGWFWGEEFHSMSLDAQAKRLGLAGKDEGGLTEWANSHGLDPKRDMWKAPAGVVAPYAIQDVRLPLRIIDLHEAEINRQSLQEVYDLESQLLPVLLKMRRRGVAVDLRKLGMIEAKANELEHRACAEATRLGNYTVTPSDTNKSAALAKLLTHNGVQVPTTDTGMPSVTSPWLRSLGTPLAASILAAKKWNKVRTTFCESIRTHEVGGRIHCTFNQLRQERETGDMQGATFGRLSSTGPNLQQQPARDPEIGPLWRSIYLPDDGGEWACIDFSSQEPRLITHYAAITNSRGGKEAAELCRTDPDWDNHSMMAAMLYDEFEPTHYASFSKAENGTEQARQHKVAKNLRSHAKTIFLGLCYGMGGGKLCRSLGLPTVTVVRDTKASGWHVFPVDSERGQQLTKQGGRPFDMAGPEGAALLAKFKDRVPYVQQLARMVQNRAQTVGYIRTLSGRKRRFPRNPSSGELWDAHKALNGLVQGGAADQTKRAMVDADAAGLRLQLQVHDELNLTVWNKDEASHLERIMVEAVPLSVPTRCDVEVGPSWGEIK